MPPEALRAMNRHVSGSRLDVLHADEPDTCAIRAADGRTHPDHSRVASAVVGANAAATPLGCAPRPLVAPMRMFALCTVSSAYVYTSVSIHPKKKSCMSALRCVQTAIGKTTQNIESRRRIRHQNKRSSLELDSSGKDVPAPTEARNDATSGTSAHVTTSPSCPSSTLGRASSLQPRQMALLPWAPPRLARPLWQTPTRPQPCR